MDASSFLQLVWPDTGFYCIATYNSHQTFDHHVFDTIPLAAAAAESLDRAGKDVFYCLSTLKERVTTNKQGKKSYRISTNLSQLKVFFFDVDVAKPGEWESLSDNKRAKKYETREEAITALKAFVAKIGWPAPTIINSGYGFHVYWLLSRTIPTIEFAPVARYLAQTASVLGFKLDSGALDLARVLRVVGTHNHKRPEAPQRVELLKGSPSYDPNALRASIEAVANQIGVPKKNGHPLPEYLDYGESNLQAYDGPPPEFAGLLKCPAINAVVEAGGNVGYYHWWHTGQVVRLAEDGRERFHAMSAGSKDYDANQTEQVLDRFENNNIGPTLCSTFEQHVHYCMDCQYHGKIKSPISLGYAREAISATPPMVELDQGDEPPLQIILPNPPDPYTRTGDKILVKHTNNAGVLFDKVILDYDLFPTKRLYNEIQDREFVQWKVNIPLEGIREISMPSSDMYDKRTFIIAMTDAGLYVEYQHLDDVRNYMICYIKELQTLARRDQLFSRLGWREDNTRFVLGDTIYSRDGAERCDVEHSGRVASAIKASGTLEEWVHIANTYNHPYLLTHQFAFATAFGAPLMVFTGHAGGIINLLGKSGEGKSATQSLVNSVWGHPWELMLPAKGEGSTYNAKLDFLTTMSSLPVCAEEITNTPPKELSTLLYSITQGSGRWRTDREGKLIPSKGLWRLILLASSNESLLETISGVKGEAAQALRLFEIRMPRTKVYTKQEFEDRFEYPLKKNYGLAGHIYANYIAKHTLEAQALVKRVMNKLDNAADIEGEERIWSALASVNIAGFMLAKECGLHHMEAKPLFDFAVRQIKQMRTKSRDSTQNAAEALAEYLNESAQGIIVVEELVPNARHTNTLTITKPTRSIIARYDRKSGLIWVAANQFKAWCIKNGRVYTDTVGELFEQGIASKREDGTPLLKVLGAGTEYKTGQVKCILIDSNNIAFAGGQLDLPMPEASNEEQPNVVPITRSKSRESDQPPL